MFQIDIHVAFGVLYCGYAALIAWLNTRLRLVALTKSNLFLLLEVVVGVGVLGLHLWAAAGSEVFLIYLRICLLAGGPMSLAMVAVELVRHARKATEAERLAEAEQRVRQVRGES